ncbi:hypothetical protein QZM46_02565 [Burkholderia vietnamiensis]|jgi:hypothetical protein|uniref:Lipoprotein n=2 Tax=Burkholderia vietnamiensis TaxID=60552 RepID=A4JK19_BURVG|nr:MULTISPECIES: hypothetical protein [Burkholderia]ABO56622.1 conserved hypothetical protein [Burkholderia vietnamiensis G4]TPQ45672.1 hypothetical protein C2U71_11505 [Burkholderia ubonensis]AFJ87626.1 hypothetical protein MYA_3267 [Burkholderia sp. KJ006]AOJ16574.1 hypothetical protein WJ02_23960 [Burkholderia vietnamiensis]AOJ99309.1 hypothetical protein WK23_12100 [Burkholderia vietnamiensis]
MYKVLISFALIAGLSGCYVAPPYGYAPAPAYGYAPAYYGYAPAYYAPAVSVGIGGHFRIR